MTDQMTMTLELEAPASPPAPTSPYEPLWRVVLAGRLGDWRLVRAPDEQAAIRGLSRSARKRVSHVRQAFDNSCPHPERKETPAC